MLNDVLLNAAILIACLSLGNQILINHDIAPTSPLRLKLFISIMLGVLGIFLMINSIQIMPKIILDFRSTPILISAIYCGFMPSILTALIIGVFRLLYLGISFTSILGLITALVVGISCGLISKLKISNREKWIYMSICILLIPTIGFVVLLYNQHLLSKLLIIYWLGTFLTLSLVYFYLQFLHFSKQNYKKYKKDSTKDHLTGLNNVRTFDTELNKVTKRVTNNSLVALLLIDIDFFKKVNDEYGHQNGDKVLEDLSKILLSSSKSSDIVSRNGGEEFSIIITDCPPENVLKVAERIRTVVEKQGFSLIDNRIINITVSIGVSIYPDNHIDKLVEIADAALYKAKRTGRNKVIVAT
ncbi:diguanylate cyclase [Desulfosporosinus sp.]|uniref:diguanylate cyclase n=1 Tax=Desulfosporosinus sp. TaxID=157907 RepID=UPI0025C6E2C3|nr:diguanylate cyclase [Desulfosporosinus sp.]MBC2728601.1 diguanylate cyclase [Desulfosporosinus sp.]